ncbi:hypothetical protein LY76DRAFT_390609 [Colletotrichum caudatum]|nr:hypothetical protein LY76DRAFT_390609 [Colletotrichum caudatum]
MHTSVCVCVCVCICGHRRCLPLPDSCSALRRSLSLGEGPDAERRMDARHKGSRRKTEIRASYGLREGRGVVYKDGIQALHDGGLLLLLLLLLQLRMQRPKPAKVPTHTHTHTCIHTYGRRHVGEYLPRIVWEFKSA